MHLSSEEALDLIEARATEDRVRFWDAHLQGCSSCRKRLNNWKEMGSLLKRENIESPPESAVRMAEAIFEFPQASEPTGWRNLIASVVFDSFAQPALAGARGAAANHQLLLTAEEFDIHIRLSGVGSERRLAGQILSRGEGTLVPGIHVHLLDQGTQVGTTTVDSLGEFEFHEVPDRPLQIQFDLPRRLTITGSLKLG
jgi:predicted anti-sigma-YlaC factor YlaD